MFSPLPVEVVGHILDFLRLSQVVPLRTLQRHVLHSSVYVTTNEKPTVYKHLPDCIKSFPHLTRITLRYSTYILDHEVQHLDRIRELELLGCNFPMFQYECLSKLTSLSTSGFTCTDESLRHLTGLTSFTLDNGDISNSGLLTLSRLEYLSLRHCPNITGHGFMNFQQLKTLQLSYINITDETFDYLPRIEELSLTYGNVSARGILKLKNLRKLNVTCIQTTCIGFDTLVHLKDVNITHSNLITDDQLIYLKHVHHLLLYGCTRIEGRGIQHLHHIQTLQLLELPLKKEYMQHLTRLHATDIFIGACNMENQIQHLYHELYPILRIME